MRQNGTFHLILASKLTMGIPTAPRIGASLVLLCVGIGLFPAYKHWVATRTWVVVDMPVSLSTGHIKVTNLYVNLNATYQMEIDLQEYEYWQHPDCQDYKVIHTRWWLSRGGKVETTWKEYWRDSWHDQGDSSTSGNGFGAFEATSGRYDLDIELVSDASCLQPFHPRLHISTEDDDYIRGGRVYGIVLLSSWALAGIGVAFLLVSSDMPHRAQLARGESLAIFDRLRVEHEAARRKLALMGRASMIPTVGYMFALTYTVLFLLFAPFRLVKYPAHGIPVRLLRPGVILASSTRYRTGLLVYVDRSGNFYLNSQPIAPEELPQALEEEFEPRADWSVYIEAESAADYQQVARAMDLVRKAHGKLIMLTPGTRAELESSQR